MFILLNENNKVIDQSLEIWNILNRLGFLNKNQYYNYKNGKTNKFLHLERYTLTKINQKEFFQANILYYPELLNFKNYL